jgi:uncharacterized damage-inducible protein DinB
MTHGADANHRAIMLATDLRSAANRLLAVVEAVDAEDWARTSDPETWSIGREVVHVAEAAARHAWIVRHTIGQAPATARPAIERLEMTTALTPNEAIKLVRHRTDEAAVLIASLTDDQLAFPTRPTRAGAEPLGSTIARVLIGHYAVHRDEIENKLRNSDRVVATERARLSRPNERRD